MTSVCSAEPCNAASPGKQRVALPELGVTDETEGQTPPPEVRPRILYNTVTVMSANVVSRLHITLLPSDRGRFWTRTRTSALAQIWTGSKGPAQQQVRPGWTGQHVPQNEEQTPVSWLLCRPRTATGVDASCSGRFQVMAIASSFLVTPPTLSWTICSCDRDPGRSALREPSAATSHLCSAGPRSPGATQLSASESLQLSLALRAPRRAAPAPVPVPAH